jgi:hypothetical protein
MADLATDLKQEFDWAMYRCLEAYEVLADGRTFERSDKDEYAIGAFKHLHDSVDDIPLPLIKATEQLRTARPELFDELLARGMALVGPEYTPASAGDFLEKCVFGGRSW